MAGGFAEPFVRAIDANRSLEDELMAAVQRQAARQRISVTDLINPRQAFFRRTRRDIRPSPDRAQTMLAGTAFHRALGQAISTEEYLEQSVEWQGIVGKIDVYEDVPVEIKTTSALPDDPSQVRPDYVDQLGMYCAIVWVARGRLVVYRRSELERTPELRAYQLEFRDLDAVRREMVRRKLRLQMALETRDPSSLPCCEWFGRGCDYGRICGCEAAPPPARVVPPTGLEVRRDPATEELLAARVAMARAPARAGFRLNDLVFPRRAACERLHADGPEETDQGDAPAEAHLRDLEQRGFRASLYQALRFGVPGAFQLVPVRLRTLADRVGMFRGTPTLLRSSGLLRMVGRDRLAHEMGHCVDRAAFEAALVGSEQARLVVYYKNLPGDRFMVYDLRFRDLAAIQAEADRRLAMLESGAPLRDLPACPAWMSRRCAFAPGCGCGEAAGLA